MQFGKFNVIKKKTWKIQVEDLNVDVSKKAMRISVFDNDEPIGDFLISNRGVKWLAPPTSRKIEKKEFDGWDKFKRLMESRGKKGKAVVSK